MEDLDQKHRAAAPSAEDAAYEECLNLEAAGELMNSRVAQIMQAIYAEKAKAEPDATLLAALDRSHHQVADDREAMSGGRSAVVLEMITKYQRILTQGPTIHE